MDEFERLLKLPSRQDILARIDEYTLYCYYLEVEELPLCKAIHSPIRGEDDFDRDPSFVVFPAIKGRGFDEFEFTWKDQAKGLTGNIFKLIQHLYGLSTFTEVYALINRDFGLDLSLPTSSAERVTLYKRPEIIEVDIRIHSIPMTRKGISFWEQGGNWRIGRDLLDFYTTTQIDYYWTNPAIPPHTCLDPTFAYRIGDKFQIYSPHAERKNKFRNNLPEDYFFGYLQLPDTGNDLIIDKSAKDVIFCRRMGYWAVCGKSETTMLPPRKMEELHRRFRRVYLMLDPDAAGQAMTEKYLRLYPWLIPRFMGVAKDKTDTAKLIGFDRTVERMRELIQAA